MKKPFHPHIFRHSRATYVLANAIMNEQQAKAYFGWSPDSDMLATYAHLIDQDANNAILRENNLTPQRQRTKELSPLLCHRCNELNQPNADYCTKCGAVLDLAKAYEHQATHAIKDQVVMNLVKLLAEKGLIDEAVEQIHQAGLGSTLKQLVEHHQNTPPPRPVQTSPLSALMPTSPERAQPVPDRPAMLPLSTPVAPE